MNNVTEFIKALVTSQSESYNPTQSKFAVAYVCPENKISTLRCRYMMS